MIDATVVLAAAVAARHGGVVIVTSDPTDLRHLVVTMKVAATIVTT